MKSYIQQVIANPDGCGSYFAVTVPGIFTNNIFSEIIKEIGTRQDMTGFFVYEIIGSQCILRARQDKPNLAIKYYLNGPNRVLIHRGPHFLPNLDHPC